MRWFIVCQIAALNSLASSFVTPLSSFPFPTSARSAKIASRATEYDLVEEPAGGEELVQLSSLEGARMKCMGEAEGITSEDGTVHKIWMMATADGKLTEEFRAQILKESKAKANFPGFRKGQIPPYAMPQIVAFAIQESLIKTTESAVVAYGLKSLPGSDGQVTVHEKVEDMCKTYKKGQSLPFTASLNCVFDPEKADQLEALKGAEEDASIAES